eukprot:sb/3465617/
MQVYSYTTGWGKIEQKAYLNTLRNYLIEDRVTNAGVTSVEEAELLTDELKCQPMEDLCGPIDTWEQAQWNEIALLETTLGMPRPLIRYEPIRSQYLGHVTMFISQSGTRYVVKTHGLDWQKIYTVLRTRTRAQVKERVKILVAKERSGNNGTTRVWSAQRTVDLLLLIQKHGDHNWAPIREEMCLQYTAAVLFRRWTRIQALLAGEVQRLSTTWEIAFLREVVGASTRVLTPSLRQKLANYLPSSKRKIAQLREILSRAKVRGRPVHLKKRLRDDEEDVGSQMPPPPDPVEQTALRNSAKETYLKAFTELEDNGKLRMFYTPPSVTTLSALEKLVSNEIPYMSEATGGRDIPDSVRNSNEYQLLLARFKSLFSWPLIMGDTPV